ncbi:hypothetical protein V498_03933 [Pseudogymnoascus sp. VKM F-4517 (FW-2822)]|nr:hypothetical protein V498_03933 [Pseudogymnoascus sp. VKM F-4517 (FW-2822)]
MEPRHGETSANGMAQGSLPIGSSMSPIGSTSLQFVTFTNFNQTTTTETKKRVRSHAQRRVQEKRRQERRGGIAKDTLPLSNADAPRSLSIGPCRLGSGRSNPFTSYPIEMNLRAHELFDHLHGNTCPMFKTLNNIGFFKTVLDEAAFRQLLCTSSAHMTRLRDETEDPETIILSTQAIRSVNNRIADPVLAISDGVLVTIIAFACHAVMFNDIKGTLTHFKGMEAIIQRRGGLEFIKSNPVLRTVIFWVDVNAAFLQDQVPRFPIPYDILPRLCVDEIASVFGSRLLQACSTNEMISATYDLLALNQYMVNKAEAGDLWDNAIFAGLYIVPLLSKLLTIRHNTLDATLAKQESCRIGALLYLSGIRRRFGIALTGDIHVQTLKRAISEDISCNTDPILPWLLVIGGVQSVKLEDRKWFISEVANLLLRLQYSTWGELVAAVRGVLWVEGILETECEQFRTDIASEVWSKYGYIFL